MKLKVLIAGAFSFLLLLNSCCTKEHCVGIEDLNHIEFYGFDDTELSEATLYLYKNSSYTNIEDSTKLFPSSTYGDLEYKAFGLGGLYLKQSKYYKVKLADNSTYTLDSFEGKKARCNTGFMCRDFYEILESYKVNGIKQEFGAVRVYK